MKSKILKIVVFLIFVGAITAFFAFDLLQYTTLEFIKSQQSELSVYYVEHKLLVAVIFTLSYIAVAALSLPVATILTLLSGALFGLYLGLILASFASSIGATLSFLIARFLARDVIQGKYSKQLAKFNEGIEREGAFYLFALRLTPLFPFFMVNAVMGVLNIKTWTFYWVSQIGMLAGTAVYVYAGTQLAQIQTLSDIASPTLMIALALLGIFPIIAKKIVDFLRKRKSYEQV